MLHDQSSLEKMQSSAFFSAAILIPSIPENKSIKVCSISVSEIRKILAREKPLGRVDLKPLSDAFSKLCVVVEAIKL